MSHSRTVPLTPQQQAVVTHDHGPALVFAVAGAGKTTAMVHRIERLVREKRFVPTQILATSFGKANVRDLKRAMRHWLHCHQVDTRTLHSLGREVIATAQQQGLVLQLQLNGRDQTTDKLNQQLLNKAIAEARKTNAPFKRELDGLDRQDFLDYVSSCKGNLHYADLERVELPAHGRKIAQQAKAPSSPLAWYLELYVLYEQVRLEQGVVTFDDMLLTGWELLVTHPPILTHIQSRYQCVLVDEFQDINQAQSEILDLITQPHRNYMAIGDDDQTVYEWRGASPTFILNFRQRYNATTYGMDDNFRCPAGALTLANEVIRFNKNRQPKRLHLTRGFHGETRLAFPATVTAMSLELVAQIQELQRAGVSLNEMAVLVRLNAQTPPVEQALIASQIPYRIEQPFYDRPEIKTLLDYGRVAWVEKRLLTGASLPEVALKTALDSWAGIVNQPKRYISNELSRRISDQVRRAPQPFSRILERVAQDAEVEEWLRDGLVKLASSLRWLVNHADEAAQPTLQQLDDRLGYTEFLRTTSGFAQTGSGRAAGVEAFIAYAAGQGSLWDFFTHIRQLKEARTGQGNVETAVTLSTIHRAKGLEWAHVFIPQCNQETIPFNGQEAANLEEERRLFYVALTRTRQNATLYCLKDEPISQFLGEARWQETLKAVQVAQEILSGSPEQMQAKEALALARTIATYQLQSYFLNWWDAPDQVKTAVAQQILRFGTAVCQQKLQPQLSLTDEMLDWWQALAPDFQPDTRADFPGLNDLIHRQKERMARPSHPQKAAPAESPPEIIRAGMWVQCDAGWGRIEQVADILARPLPQDFAENTFLRLTVTLRPDQDAEPIEVDVSASRITFLKAEKVYTCSLCEQFSAERPQTIERLHSKLAHDDKVAYRREVGLTRRLTRLAYAETYDAALRR